MEVEVKKWKFVFYKMQVGVVKMEVEVVKMEVCF